MFSVSTVHVQLYMYKVHVLYGILIVFVSMRSNVSCEHNFTCMEVLYTVQTYMNVVIEIMFQFFVLIVY